ncbi:MAG TPA: YidB family protein [Terriglobales bacterium]
MGIIDSITEKFAGGSGEANPAVAGVLEMINNHPGGVSGLIQAFHDKGMSEVVTSWVGSGQNLPVTAEQIQNVLGSDVVKQFAGKLGLSPDVATAHLSELLPGIIDKLSPNGQVAAPSSGNLVDMAKNMLGSLGKTGTDA